MHDSLKTYNSFNVKDNDKCVIAIYDMINNNKKQKKED